MFLSVPDRVRSSADFAYKIPDALDSASTAPLLCAGITVYTPLRTYIKYPGMKVGIVGIGGLGHLAIKFARAMGAKVTVLSSSADKEAEAKEWGCLLRKPQKFIRPAQAVSNGSIGSARRTPASL